MQSSRFTMIATKMLEQHNHNRQQQKKQKKDTTQTEKIKNHQLQA